MTPSVLRPAKGTTELVTQICGLMATSRTMIDGCGSLQADSSAKLEQSVFLESRVLAMPQQATVHRRRTVLGFQALVERDCLMISSAPVDPS